MLDAVHVRTEHLDHVLLVVTGLLVHAHRHLLGVTGTDEATTQVTLHVPALRVRLVREVDQTLRGSHVLLTVAGVPPIQDRLHGLDVGGEPLVHPVGDLGGVVGVPVVAPGVRTRVGGDLLDVQLQAHEGRSQTPGEEELVEGLTRTVHVTRESTDVGVDGLQLGWVRLLLQHVHHVTQLSRSMVGRTVEGVPVGHEHVDQRTHTGRVRQTLTEELGIHGAEHLTTHEVTGLHTGQGLVQLIDVRGAGVHVHHRDGLVRVVPWKGVRDHREHGVLTVAVRVTHTDAHQITSGGPAEVNGHGVIQVPRAMALEELQEHVTREADALALLVVEDPVIHLTGDVVTTLDERLMRDNVSSDGPRDREPVLRLTRRTDLAQLLDDGTSHHGRQVDALRHLTAGVDPLGDLVGQTISGQLVDHPARHLALIQRGEVLLHEVVERGDQGTAIAVEPTAQVREPLHVGPRAGVGVVGLHGDQALAATVEPHLILDVVVERDDVVIDHLVRDHDGVTLDDASTRESAEVEAHQLTGLHLDPQVVGVGQTSRHRPTHEVHAVHVSDALHVVSADLADGHLHQASECSLAGDLLQPLGHLLAVAQLDEGQLTPVEQVAVGVPDANLHPGTGPGVGVGERAATGVTAVDDGLTHLVVALELAVDDAEAVAQLVELSQVAPAVVVADVDDVTGGDGRVVGDDVDVVGHIDTLDDGHVLSLVVDDDLAAVLIAGRNSLHLRQAEDRAVVGGQVDVHSASPLHLRWLIRSWSLTPQRSPSRIRGFRLRSEGVDPVDDPGLGAVDLDHQAAGLGHVGGVDVALEAEAVLLHRVEDLQHLGAPVQGPLLLRSEDGHEDLLHVHAEGVVGEGVVERLDDVADELHRLLMVVQGLLTGVLDHGVDVLHLGLLQLSVVVALPGVGVDGGAGHVRTAEDAPLLGLVLAGLTGLGGGLAQGDGHVGVLLGVVDRPVARVVDRLDDLVLAGQLHHVAVDGARDVHAGVAEVVHVPALAVDGDALGQVVGVHGVGLQVVEVDALGVGVPLGERAVLSTHVHEDGGAVVGLAADEAEVVGVHDGVLLSTWWCR